jgi:hypothetical protein
VYKRQEEWRAKREAAQEAARAKRSRWALMLAGLRYPRPLSIGAVGLLVGIGLGAWLAWSGRLDGLPGVLFADGPGIELRLRLERSLR